MRDSRLATGTWQTLTPADCWPADVCDSLVRTGITNILILNGHGGNVKPMMYRIDEYKERLSNIYLHG